MEFEYSKSYSYFPTLGDIEDAAMLENDEVGPAELIAAFDFYRDHNIPAPVDFVDR